MRLHNICYVDNILILIPHYNISEFSKIFQIATILYVIYWWEWKNRLFFLIVQIICEDKT